MPDIYLAIDAYRLISEPNTSGAFQVYELALDLSKQSSISQVILLLPREIDGRFNFQDLLSIEKIKMEISEKPCFPEKNFIENVKWIQHTIPNLLKKTQATHMISPYHQTPLKAKRSIKIITIINDVCGIKPSAGYIYNKKGPYKHWFNFITALIRADGFVYISKYTKNAFETFFKSTSKRPSIVIYPKPTLAKQISMPAVKEILQKAKVVYKDYFFAIGTLDYRKGTDLTLRAFKRYKDLGGGKNLVLLTPLRYVNEIKELIKNYPQSIYVISNLSIMERDVFYAGAVALIFPSRCEGFGYPILEAMYQGCPPIALRDSPAEEIILGSVQELNSLDIDEIVDLMFCYDSKPIDDQQELMQQLVKRANEFILEIDNGKKIIELIQSL